MILIYFNRHFQWNRNFRWILIFNNRSSFLCYTLSHYPKKSVVCLWTSQGKSTENNWIKYVGQLEKIPVPTKWPYLCTDFTKYVYEKVEWVLSELKSRFIRLTPSKVRAQPAASKKPSWFWNFIANWAPSCDISKKTSGLIISQFPQPVASCQTRENQNNDNETRRVMNDRFERPDNQIFRKVELQFGKLNGYFRNTKEWVG